MAETIAKLRHLSQDATLKVHIVVTREFRFRMWAAKELIRLAAWVLGVGVKVDSSIEDDE